MAPAPNTPHQVISFDLTLLLGPFVRGNQLGCLLYSPVDVIFSEENTLQPDLIFVSREREHIITNRGCEGAPDIVVEILSPSTRARDLETKREIYARYGVGEYWIVDPVARTVRLLELAGNEFVTRALLDESGEITSPLLPGLSIPVSRIFAYV